MRRNRATKRTFSAFCGVLTWLACLGVLLPQPAVAASPPQLGPPTAAEPFRVVDVALGPQGMLNGLVIDPQGIPLPATRVVLFNGSREVALSETDEQGHFVFREITGGVYGVSAAGATRACRLWAPHTAPPAANDAVLIVSDDETVRGRGVVRDHSSHVYTWISEHKFLTYAFVAAAITVPVVLIDANRDHTPSSP